MGKCIHTHVVLGKEITNNYVYSASYRCKLYSCVFDLSSDNIFNNISVKVSTLPPYTHRTLSNVSSPDFTLHSFSSLQLLSLKGKEHVHLRKLLLDVSEDHGGSREETSSKSSSAYHHQLLSSLASQKLPPLLQGLVSSLQLASSRDPGSNAPSDLIGMSHALREVHSVLSPPPVNEPTPTTQTTTEEPNIEEPATVSDVTASQPDQDELLSKLEERLKTYIDTKFAELEQKIETRLESIFTDRVNGPPPTLPHVNNEETNCYGLVEDLSQLD